MDECLFCKIIAKEIPSEAVYEDDKVVAFLDIKPVNPGHVLVVPKTHRSGLEDASPEALQEVIVVTQRIARALINSGLCESFNLVENNGKIAGQVIPHLHFHVIPRRSDDGLRHWPGQEMRPEQAHEIAQQIARSL